MKASNWPNFLGATWFWWIVLITGAALGAFLTCVIRLLVGDGEKAPWVELFAALFAAAAFIVALATYRFASVKSRNDLFGAMHDRLISKEVQATREFLSNATKDDVRRLFEPGNSMFQDVNHTLALYETFSMFAEKRLVNAELYEEAWGRNLRTRRQAILWFLDYREANDKFPSWPHLRRFLNAQV